MYQRVGAGTLGCTVGLHLGGCVGTATAVVSAGGVAFGSGCNGVMSAPKSECTVVLPLGGALGGAIRTCGFEILAGLFVTEPLQPTLRPRRGVVDIGVDARAHSSDSK